MDANGTRFHLLLGREDWFTAGEPSVDLQWNVDDHTVGLAARPSVLRTGSGAARIELDQRRGAGRDRFGHWYWIDDDRTAVRILPHDAQAAETYWPGGSGDCRTADDVGFDCVPADVESDQLAGLAVTARHHLVVGAPSANALVLFDLASGGPPRTLRWPDGVDFRPWDLAADADGGVWVLDVAPSTAARPHRLWHLDRWLRVVQLGAPGPATAAPVFAPKAPDAPVEPTSTVGTIDATMAAEPALTDPIAIDVLDERTVVVLDRGPGGTDAILHHLDDGALVDSVDLIVPVGPSGSGLPIVHDLAVVAGADGSPLVYVVDDRGEQVFAFAVEGGVAVAAPTEAHLPLRLFSGKAIVAAAGRGYYDLGDRWLPIVDWKRPAFADSAVLESDVFDGREPGCVWHRALLDACIPPGTSVSLATRASDDPDELALLPWRTEPPLHARDQGPELANHLFGAGGDSNRGTFELLCQSAVGRHLQVRLTLSGDGRRTPRLWALRLYFPRFSYLSEYLPEAFRGGEDGGAFLGRYLANPEGTLTTIEDRIAAFQAVLDPATTAGEHLGWLASWFGVALDADWDDDRRRLFVRHAVEFLARRGTVRGLVELIRVATDPCPDDSIFDAGPDPAFGVRVVERYRVRAAPGVVYGDPTDLSVPRWVADSDERWELADGGARLEQAYTDFLEARYDDVADLVDAWGLTVLPASFGSLPFPVLTPDQESARADRRDFIGASLAVYYADVTVGDLDSYRAFLADRYGRIADLNTAWGLMGGSEYGAFGEVNMPSGLPPDGARLVDWIHYVSLVLPAERAAHGFTVLVPISPTEPDAERELRLGRVRRIVAEERPAHTWFDVRPFWAALRVGEARVGLETVVGEGSRYVEMALGHGRLAQTYLSGGARWGVADRFVLGRDAVAAAPVPTAGESGDG